LLGERVFVGGQVAELLVTDPAAIRIRPTNDVDVVTMAATRTQYAALGERLRTLGFGEDTTPHAPLCRWRSSDGVVLDVMPMNESILGFSNAWYGAADRDAMRYAIAPGLHLRIAGAAAYIATKWAAFDNRGDDDHLGSHDVEDIVTVTAGRPELPREVRDAAHDLREWLRERTQRFLAHRDAPDAIAGALPDARLDPDLIQRVEQRFRLIAEAAT
jgi:hypothetical protein